MNQLMISKEQWTNELFKGYYEEVIESIKKMEKEDFRDIWKVL